jgi:signal transduction histidine kinase
LAASAAPALDAAATHQRLRAAHERLVATREEERRRLRRELHDDLAPTLAGLSLTAAAAAELLERDPARSVDVHRSLAEGIGAAVHQVRDIAYDLRPPILDDRGLLAAVHERVVTADPGGPQVEVCGSCPDELPAAVGSAALRIVQEAVTNTRRHAAASRCQVHVDSRPDALVVEIRDDGRGVQAGAARGVGLLAMSERAEELGGTMEVLTGPSGTTVRAVLPWIPSPS